MIRRRFLLNHYTNFNSFFRHICKISLTRYTLIQFDEIFCVKTNWACPFLRNIQTCSLFFLLNESNLRRLSSLKIPIAQKGRLRPISKRGVPKRGLKTAHGVMVCAPYLEKKTRTLLSSTSFGPFLVYNLYPVLAYKDLLLNVFYNT